MKTVPEESRHLEPQRIIAPPRYAIVLTSAVSLALGVALASVSLLHGTHHAAVTRVGRLPGTFVYPTACIEAFNRVWAVMGYNSTHRILHFLVEIHRWSRSLERVSCAFDPIHTDLLYNHGISSVISTKL